MWGPLSSRWDGAVRSSAQPTVRCDVLSSGQIVASGIAVSGGSVTSDRTQVVRRKLQMTVPDTTLAPDQNTDLLTPYGNEVRIWHGFTYPTGDVELVPVGTFGLWTVAEDLPVGQLTVQASDRMQRVTDARFVSQRTLLAGSSTIGSISQMLLEAVPWAAVRVDPKLADIILPAAITEPRDRAGFIAKLAANLGGEVFADQLGDFVIQSVPSVTSAPVWTVDTGANGVLISAAPSVTRDGVRNAIIVSGQTTGTVTAPVTSGLLANGIDPVCADYDTSSATYWYGSFGQVPGYIDSSTFTNQVQCQVAGFAALRNYQGAARSIDFSSLLNPALAEGDVFAVIINGAYAPHILDQLTIPLDVATPMSGSTRTTTGQEQTS